MTVSLIQRVIIRIKPFYFIKCNVLFKLGMIRIKLQIIISQIEYIKIKLKSLNVKIN